MKNAFTVLWLFISACVLSIIFYHCGFQNVSYRADNSLPEPVSLNETSSSDLPKEYILTQKQKSKSFKFPSSLRNIEEEAFEGTAAETILLPESIEQIHRRAFSDMSCLKILNLPARLSFISRDAFAGSKNIQFIGAENTYANRWAMIHRYSFASVQPQEQKENASQYNLEKSHSQNILLSASLSVSNVFYSFATGRRIDEDCITKLKGSEKFNRQSGLFP